MSSDDKIEFKPVTSGLGFHPFSDGMPYAPVSKSRLPQRPGFSEHAGSGAVAAGPPRFVPPQITIPTTMRPKPQSAILPVTPTASPIALATDFGWTYLFKRVVAYVIDTSLHLGIASLTFGFALHKLGVGLAELRQPELLVLGAAFLWLLNWSLIASQEIAFRTSLGKRLMGLRLEGGAATLFLRAFFFAMSFGLAGFGLLWALFDKKKRTWHDLITDCQPIEIADL